MPIVRTVVRSLIAGALAVAVSSLAGLALAVPVALATPVTPAGPATASATVLAKASQQSTRTIGASASGVAVSIDSVSPQYASANSTITVKGTITNHTGGPLYGVQVQLDTSSTYFNARSQMSGFSSGEAYLLNPVSGNPWPAPSTLHSGATMSWSASFQAADQGYQKAYEVYPVQAQALSSEGAVLGNARTFLPYWPGSDGGAPDKLATAWIWPLIDTPQQGACSQDLATNELASSLATGGRLNGLLTAGLEYAGRTSLTWAVDPALLSDASVMTQRYKVGGDALCKETVAMPASGAATTWLKDLKAGTAGEQMFVTPYADPDVSALVHAGLDSDLVQSYALGDTWAQQLLGEPFGPGATVASPSGGAANAIAWPDGGAADSSVLTSLARDGDVGTTVLNSNEMPALRTATGTYQPDDAVGSVTTGIGTTMGVLLADSGITSDLNAASAQSSPGAKFAVEQDFLAETAMIVAEAPNTARSLVIAPPQRWDPSEGEAAALLGLTTKAPWIQSVPLSTLAGKADKHAAGPARQSLPGSSRAPQELSRNYMNEVQSVRAGASLYKSMLYKPTTAATTTLEDAVAVTESSAWRGQASSGGWLAMSTLASYFGYREDQVQIITKNNVVLAGPSGDTPVSVSNGLDVAVQVEVRALVSPDSRLSIGNYSSLLTIQPGQTGLVRLPVRSAALGTTSLQLELVAPNGSPLTSTQSLSVESTRFGRTLLIVIAAALGVLVLSSLARWVRRKWHEGISVAEGESGETG